MDVVRLLNERYPAMSKGHKKITDYIREHMDEAAFMTAAKLGQAVGVSESTVVRYAMSLGFEGYPEFMQALSQLLRGRLTNFDRIDGRYSSEPGSKLVESVIENDIRRLSETMVLVDKDAFEAAMDLISNAGSIYIVGIRQEAPLAAFLGFYLNIMFANVHLIQTSSMSELFEQMLGIGEQDVLIGISFPRYSVRALKAMEFANSRRAAVIALTDGRHSPVNMYSSVNLFARTGSLSIVDSMVAPLSLINALVVGLTMKRRDKVTQNLKLLEEIWDDYQVYGNDEMDPGRDMEEM